MFFLNRAFTGEGENHGKSGKMSGEKIKRWMSLICLVISALPCVFIGMSEVLGFISGSGSL